MSDAAAPTAPGDGAARATPSRARWLDHPRAETLLPLVGAYLLLATLYAWQAWRRETPTIFSDELELTQISRAIADSGEPARRGEPYSFTTLVPWLTAPFWWIQSVAPAYETIKYVQALAMATAIFPAYGIARAVVARPWALFAATGTIAAPALSYAPMLVEEPWAYPAATLALWLGLRAVIRPARGTVALALGGALLAAAVRSQLATLLLALLLALGAVAWGSRRIRAWRGTWTGWDRVGAVVLGVGLVLGVSALMGHLSTEWEVTTGFWKGRILEYGLWAGGAFAVGLGMLPVVALLASLALPAGERARPGVRPFLILTGATVASVAWYAAVKGAYVSTIFSSLVVERNLIYLTPLAMTATALLLERPAARWWGVVAAGGLTLWAVVATPIERGAESFPYYEAHGLAIVALANRELAWPVGRIDTALVVLVVAATAALLLLCARASRGRSTTGLAVGLATAVLAWTVTSEVYAAIGEHDFSARLYAGLPRPTDWIDRAADGGTVTVLSQQVRDATGLQSYEFWNRSIVNQWSVDGTAPPPGPTLTPDLADVDGTLTPAPGTDFVLAVNGIEVAGEEVARGAGTTDVLVRIDGPIRLRSNVTGVYADGWTGERAAYNRFDPSGGGSGTAVVRVSRATFCPDDVRLPGPTTVRIGTMAVGSDSQPAIGRVTGSETVYVPGCGERTVGLPTPDGPWRIEIETATFVPAEIDPEGTSERRALGVQVSFTVVPG